MGNTNTYNFGGNRGDSFNGDCKLVRKETLCDSRGEPVRRFTFRTPPGTNMKVNTALRQVVLVRALGQLRMYSPTSEPDRADGTFDLVVRVYRQGLVSRWLDDVPLGGTVPMTWPFPSMLPSDRHNPGRRVGLIALGIGITELYRVAVNELRDPNVEEVVLLYATKTMAEQVLGPELEALMHQEPARFRLERTLSKECVAGARSGRVDPKMLQDVFPWADSHRSDVRFLTAGTREMMDNVQNMLDGLGYDRETYKLIRDLSASGLMRAFFR